MSHRKSHPSKKTKKNKSKEGPYFEDIIHVAENLVKDFEFLVNTPVCEDDDFVFKSEKNWSIDVSKYSEYFMLDLKILSAAIEAIPFNENVNVDIKYFTTDQLTDMYNKAERAKETYNRIINSSEMHVINEVKNVDEKQNSIDDTADDLDFLLSLQEPVNEPSMSVKPSLTPHSTASELTATPGTSVDLEKWLDSMLDD